MPAEEKSLLDAVSAAIDGDATTPEPKEAANAVDDAAPVADAVDGEPAEGEEAPAEGATDGESAEGKDGAEAGGEGDKGAEGKKTGEDGKPAAEAATGEAAKKPAEGKVEPVKQPTDAEKRAAAINDPVDQRLKEGTRNRIQFLANEVKAQDKQLADMGEVFESIASTGMNPDELAMMLGYAHARHKGTPEQKKQAYQFLKEELRAIAVELGETDVVDLVAGHKDLSDAVANNSMSIEHARELAVARERAARATASTEASRTQTEAQRAHEAGANALGQTAAQLHKRDGEAVFAAKKAILTAALKPVLASLPPARWAKTFLDAYEGLPAPAAPVAAIVPPVNKPQGQPMRPSTPAGGGGTPAPKSMKDAVFAALDGGTD